MLYKRVVGFFVVLFLISLVSADYTILTDPSSVIVGNPTTFTFDIQNPSSAAGSEVEIVRFILPSGMTYVTGSQGTDVTGTNFYTFPDGFKFVKITPYLIGLNEIHSFWIDLNVSVAGSYDLLINITNNSNTYTYIVPLSFVNPVASDFPPNASFGDSPKDNFTSTSDEITFKLKCKDDIGVKYIQLWGNWEGGWHLIDENYSVVNDVVWSTKVSGISNGDYVWGVYCEDSGGNYDLTNTNRSFTVDADPTKTPPDGSFFVTDAQFKAGYKKRLQIGGRLRFNYDDELHYVKINKIMSESVEIEVASTPRILSLVEGDSKKVDLNSDSYFDLYVSLLNTTLDGTEADAEVQIKQINESIPENETVNGTLNETINITDINGTSSDGLTNNSLGAGGEEIEGDNLILYIIIGGIAIIVIVAIMFIIYKTSTKKAPAPVEDEKSSGPVDEEDSEEED